jgi:hypothetical protein
MVDMTDEFFGENPVADATEVDEGVASGGLIAAGMYHAQLTEVKRKEVNGTQVDELVFTILAGQYKGRKTKKQIWYGVNTDKKSQAEIEEAKARTKNDFWTTGKALGLAEKVAGADGKLVYRIVKGKKDFREVMDAQCVVKVTQREYEDKKTQEKKKSSEVGLFGVLAADDPKAKDVQRGGTLAASTAKTPEEALADLL